MMITAMDWINLGIAAINTLLALVVFFSNPKRAVNITGGIFFFATALWNVSNFSAWIGDPVVWFRTTYALGPLFTNACLVFLLYFCETQLSRWIIPMLALTAFAVAALAFGTNLIVGYATLESFHTRKFLEGFLFAPYSLYLITVAIGIVWVLFSGLRKSTGLKRLQIQYILFGLSAFALVSILGSLILPLLGVFSFMQADSPSSIFLLMIIGYVILRNRLFDIRRLIVLMGVSIFVLILLMLIQGFVTFYLQNLLPPVAASLFSSTSAVTILGCAFLLLRNTKAIQSLFSFFGSPRLESLQGSVQEMLRILDKDALLRFVSQSLLDLFHLRRVCVFWADEETSGGASRYRLFLDSEATDRKTLAAVKPSFLTIDHSFVQALRDNREVLVSDELRQEVPEPGVLSILSFMENHGAKIAIPCFIRNNLSGFVLLGEKPDNQAFTKEDLSAIGLFFMQAGTALQNAFLYEDAISDGLTKLFNRRYLQARLEEQVEVATRYKRPFAVLMIDIDHFKSVNDRFGHPAGDRVLERVAKCIRKSVRSSDITARYGGEEFVVILQELGTMANAEIKERRLAVFAVAERIRLAIEHAQIMVDAKTISVTASVGCCIFGEQSTFSNVPDLIQFADRALYAAKKNGRNITVISEFDLFLALNPKTLSLCPIPAEVGL
jgi:diguanylate cyclase (GGDEF)-like protein